jgi:hypothetical protein
MFSALGAKIFIWLLGIASAGGFLLWLKNSYTNWIREKEEDDRNEETIKILGEQRDSPIHSVADADKLWDTYDPRT